MVIKTPSFKGYLAALHYWSPGMLSREERKSIKNKKQAWYALFFNKINAGMNLRKVQTQTC